jgi:hypothetical protein
MLLLASAAVVIGACSDTQSPSAPSDEGELTFVLDESAASAALESAEPAADDAAGSAQLGTGGPGKNSVDPMVVSCVRNRVHVLCLNVRAGRLRAADADAVVTRYARWTRAQLRVNGFLLARSGRFGPNFVGEEIFANYRNLNYRVFRGDRICSQFPGATTQVCGVLR